MSRTMTREEWLGKRSSPSLGRLFKQRSKMVHVSCVPTSQNTVSKGTTYRKKKS